MIKKVLIANRGEIALRIIRACKELGIKTVAIHSTADEFSLHRRFADEDVCIGPPQSGKSYLHIPSIISACEVSGADAVHPGYGFLAENSQFAQICIDNKISFIGPSKEVIDKMGDKATARKIMKEAGVPIIPGSDIVKSVEEAVEVSKKIGLPVIIKATAGGGGKGMRIVRSMDDLEVSFNLARIEASRAFHNPDVYIEKFFESSHHIEIQVLSDSFNNVIHLGERDCSIQRKHQKLVEEAPSPFLSSKTRKKICEVAVKGVRSVNYVGVGTVEFLLDDDGKFYFMEMNTRIQVEHPITEAITGVDIVKGQIRVACGEKLPYKQSAIVFRGHAIECRINAEDPFNNFMPSAGKIYSYNVPGGFGVRVDSHVYPEYEIPSYYDSLLAKLIVWGEDREEAIAKMKRSLDEFIVEGVNTTIPLHSIIMTDKQFNNGKYNTNFLDSISLDKKEING